MSEQQANIAVRDESNAPRVKTDLTRLSLGQTMKVAETLFRSGYFDKVKNADQAFAKILAGQEFGLAPMQALASIHIVEGKPTLDATMVRARIKSSGKYDVRTRSSTDIECTLEFFENGKSLGKASFTIEDARRAELLGKLNWKRYPKAMLLARTTTAGAREFCPDIFGGPVYTMEELSGVDDFSASDNARQETAPGELRNATPQGELRNVTPQGDEQAKAVHLISAQQIAYIEKMWVLIPEGERTAFVVKASGGKAKELNKLTSAQGGELYKLVVAHPQAVKPETQKEEASATQAPAAREEGNTPAASASAQSTQAPSPRAQVSSEEEAERRNLIVDIEKRKTQLRWTDAVLAATVREFSKGRTDILPDLDTLTLKELDAHLYIVVSSEPAGQAA